MVSIYLLLIIKIIHKVHKDRNRNIAKNQEYRQGTLIIKYTHVTRVTMLNVNLTEKIIENKKNGFIHHQVAVV